MRAGAARAEITPPPGTELAGYFNQRFSKGAHDPLYAKALVVEERGEAAAIIVCDVIALARQMVEAIRAAAGAAAEVAPERILVAATHTHLAPVTLPILQSEPAADWLAALPARAAEAAAEARSRMRDAQLRAGATHVEGLGFNRRYRMRDGSVRTNPGVGSPEIVEPAGPTDPELIVMAFGAAGEAPAAIIANYTCHLDTIGGDLVSADYPAYLAQTVRAALPDTEVLFLYGAAGDINHINVNEIPPRFAGVERARWMGSVLAEQTLALLPDLRPSPGPVRVASQMLPVSIRRPSPEDAEAGRRVLAGMAGAGSLDAEAIYAREAALVAELASVIEMEMMALRLGGCGIATFPGEVFVELGLEVKRRSPFSPTLISTVANGYEGYIATRKAYDEGGYEVRLARSSKVAPGAGEQMVEALLGLLDRLAD